MTSCEESGLLGAQAYARAHGQDAAGTTFVNFDTVGGDVPLTYILHEGGPARFWPASPRLVELAEAIARRRPELGLAPGADDAGAPDRRHRIPRARLGGDHVPRPGSMGSRTTTWPTDTYENIAPEAVARALETGRELLRELDPNRLGVRAAARPSTGTAARVHARIRLDAASSARFAAAERRAERRLQAGPTGRAVGANAAPTFANRSTRFGRRLR